MSGNWLRAWGAGRSEKPSRSILQNEDLPVLPDSLRSQISTVEAAALAVYARHGLPTDAGGYVRRGAAGTPWEKLPDGLSIEDKWALMEAAPPGSGWRYADRSCLGRQSDIAELRQASLLLSACAGLTARLEGRMPTTPQDVADALQLGATSAMLASAIGQGDTGLDSETQHSPLTFEEAAGKDTGGAT